MGGYKNPLYHKYEIRQAIYNHSRCEKYHRCEVVKVSKTLALFRELKVEEVEEVK